MPETKQGMNSQPAIAVAINPAHTSDSTSLAKHLNLPVCIQSNGYNSTDLCSTFDLFLSYEDDDSSGLQRLTITNSDGNLGSALYVDFIAGKVGHRHRFGGGRGQPLAKAIGLKGGANPTVIDATAGLGRDAFVIASLGAQVMLIERSPIVAALLKDGLGRASHNTEIKTIVTERMNLVTANAIDWLTNLPTEKHPDVVYMDPMYPHRNKSALVKKEMRVLRELAGDDEDASQLLHAALTCAKRRVTVKRPRTAPILGGSILNNRKPNSTVESKNTRYDIYVP